MGDREDFLAYLRSRFGSCGRKLFLQKLRDRFQCDSFDVPSEKSPSIKASSAKLSPIQQELPSAEETSPYRVIDIRGADDWRSYVERLKDISLLENVLHCAEQMSKKNDMKQFAVSIRSMQKKLMELLLHVDKKFKLPEDIDEDTSEALADKIGAFVKAYLLDFLRICRNSVKYSQGVEQRFYKDFAESVEKYLSSISVYCKNIAPGENLHTYGDWFETPTCRETCDPKRIGIIDTIDFLPHFMFFRNAYEEREERKIKGSCIVFTARRKR